MMGMLTPGTAKETPNARIAPTTNSRTPPTTMVSSYLVPGVFPGTA
ncbi:hypothetical protein [Pseudolysinimonas kribbensis]|nr:hypothetical protein [Pseudolysinimonas kribbensis]